MPEDRAGGLLGLARRAGRIGAGTNAALQLLRSGRAELVIVASDAAPRTKGLFSREAGRYGIRALEWADTRRLGLSIGATPKAVVVLTDRGLAGAFLLAASGASGQDLPGGEQRK
ncbi:MAG: ribosomal L7Ae/L30e/S12e/Gadd45 family protein [Firmicutes bacterium]|nr:ribosomal L7Ae/L30e/S12e/Gadd45 family protein [Bacillota bacterium]